MVVHELFLFCVFCFFFSLMVSRLLACACCGFRIPCDDRCTALRRLLSAAARQCTHALVVSLVSWFCDHTRACIPQSQGMKNRQGHWVCWMSTGAYIPEVQRYIYTYIQYKYILQHIYQVYNIQTQENMVWTRRAQTAKHHRPDQSHWRRVCAGR